MFENQNFPIICLLSYEKMTRYPFTITFLEPLKKQMIYNNQGLCYSFISLLGIIKYVKSGQCSR